MILKINIQILRIKFQKKSKLKRRNMALIKCIECGNEISNKAEVCPNCGCPVSETVKEKNNKKRKC